MNKAFTQQELMGFSEAVAPTPANAPQSEPNVTEIIIAKNRANSVQMLLPMLTRLNQEKRWLAWIDPPIELLKSWRKEQHSNVDEIMILRSSEKTSALDLCEQALEKGTCHAAIIWTAGLTNEAFSRLETASAKGNSHGIVLRSR